MVSHGLLLAPDQGQGQVLILIVMDNGLSLSNFRDEKLYLGVLILIVMDNGLSP